MASDHEISEEFHLHMQSYTVQVIL